MKPSITALLTTAIAVVAPLDGHAFQHAQIGLRVEYYEVDHLTANELVTAPTDQTDATSIRKQLLAKVALDEARLVDSTYVVTRSGQRAKNDAYNGGKHDKGQREGVIEENDKAAADVEENGKETETFKPFLKPGALVLHHLIRPP